MSITERDVQTLLSDLVRIESVTPWLIPDGSGEGAIAAYMREHVRDLPVEVSLDEVEPGRVNFIARLPGTGGGPTLCLNAHADTVGFENWRDRALTPRLEGERLFGLGVADDKACCAMALLALRELATGPSLRGDLLVACTADEEGISIGTEDLLRRHGMHAAIVLEPDALPRVCVEHQGFGWMDIVVHGRPAHGSAPDVGIDAIVHLAEVITRLHRLDAEVYAANPDPRNGRTVFHTGTVSGGTDYATYPATAVLGIEIGTQPGEHLSDRVREIEGIFTSVRQDHPDFTAEVRVKLDREPFRAEGHEELLEHMNQAAASIIGAPLEPAGLNAWTDAALMQSSGIPTLLFGPLGGNFHAPDEWVSIPETAKAAAIVAETGRRFLM